MSHSSGEAQADLLLRLPPEIAGSFTAEQRAALYNATRGLTWRRFPINVRVSLPLVGRRYFVTIVGGSERRSPERWHRERRLHPLRTLGNVMFMVGAATLFYVLAVMAIFLFSSVVEF